MFQTKLSSPLQVRQFASDFLSRFQTLDVLVLNAGVFGLEFRLTDEDQLDETFQVNYLSQVYLASLLKGAMSKTLKPRLVSVSAESHRCSIFPLKLDRKRSQRQLTFQIF